LKRKKKCTKNKPYNRPNKNHIHDFFVTVTFFISFIYFADKTRKVLAKKKKEEGNRLENRAELAPKVDASCQQTNHKYHDKKNE